MMHRIVAAQIRMGALALTLGLSLISAAETFTETKADGTTISVDLNRSGAWNGAYSESKDQQVLVKGQYRNGKKAGKWQWFSADGEVSQRQDFKDDLLHGTSQRFYPNGTCAVAAKYQNGEQIGPLLVYDQAGKPQRVIHIPRSAQDVSAILKRDWPHQALNATYVVTPSAEAPLIAGELEAAVLEQALHHARCYRLLSGADVTGLSLDPEKNRQAQYASVLLSIIGSLSHTPSKPPGVPDDFFTIAYNGCNRSNISQGPYALFAAVNAFMEDSNASNIARVGHRRWALSPKLGKIGFGTFKNFSAMHVVGGEVASIPDWQLIAFPGEGAYPIEFIQPRTAWSVLLNATHFPRDGSPTVSVHRMDENYQIIEDIPTKIIAVDAKNEDGAYHIIFKPEVATSGRYWVRLTGMKAPKDRPLDCGYFVDLQGFQSALAGE